MTVVEEHAPDGVLNEATTEEGVRLLDDRGISRVEEHSESLRSRQGADVPVAEIEAKQLGVVRCGERSSAAACGASSAGNERGEPRTAAGASRAPSCARRRAGGRPR